MNITTDSASNYRAFLKANKEIVKKDIQRLKLKGQKKISGIIWSQQQADLTGRAAESKFRSKDYIYCW